MEDIIQKVKSKLRRKLMQSQQFMGKQYGRRYSNPIMMKWEDFSFL